MSTSAVPKKMNSQSSTKKLSSSFILLSSLLILLAAASLAEAAIDVFNDDECNYNPMRKPPRFGKRSHNVADLTDGDLLGIDPAALDRATGPGSSGSGYRPRRSSNCIRRPAASPHAARLARRLCAGQPPEDQRQSEALPQDDRGEC
ncbi:hypothetical protein TYRP_018082 [Tyrophagus putrescentiae]|nr:hypothetical protein TYRP_018082 [Tyrophagus putrescentiae]